MRMSRVLVLVLAGSVACSGDRRAEEGSASASVAAAESPRAVQFTATDFAFEGPSTIEAGVVTFVFENHGQTWHHLQLVRLPAGWSMQDFQEAMSQAQPGAPLPEWFEDAGGVNPPAPGAPARVTMAVEPGEYAVLCLVDTPDKVPHVFKGMIRPLTVTASTEPERPLPAAQLSLTLADYAFGFSQPLTSGTHVIRVENVATQSHEIAFFRFEPGKTMDDLMAWAETYDGPPPVSPAGGVSGIRPGQSADVEVTLTPGQYVAICFLPDATDGAPHLVHGMVLPFAVS